MNYGKKTCHNDTIYNYAADNYILCIENLVTLNHPPGICSSCSHGDVRLVDGSVPSEGHVEMCTDGQWGTVCVRNYQYYWNEVNTDVVCRQLGYHDGEWVIHACYTDQHDDMRVVGLVAVTCKLDLGR